MFFSDLFESKIVKVKEKVKKGEEGTSDNIDDDGYLQVDRPLVCNYLDCFKNENFHEKYFLWEC